MPQSQGVRFLSSHFSKALILEEPDPSLDDYLRSQGIEPERLPKSQTQDVDAILEILREGQHDLLYKRSRFEVDEAVLTASDRLAAIMLCCIGDDSVDKEACARHGVLVTNDPISNGRSVVELVFGELICLSRRIFDANDRIREHHWTKSSTRRYEIKGKKLGILGLGNIGKQVAQMGEAFGMEIVFFDDRELAREVGAALGWTVASSVEDLFRSVDMITLHVSAENVRGQSNRNMLDYEHFRLLGESRGEDSPRLLINAGRGFLFEPEELQRAVREGHVRGAAIDVFPEEPGSEGDGWENPYAGLEEVVATPHIGAATREAQPRIASYVSGTTRLLNCSGTVRSCVYSPGTIIGLENDRTKAILAVVHSDVRGTKKAISDSIFNAGLNNLESKHRDFPKYGIAYDISSMDGELSQTQLRELIESARAISGEADAIRSVRQIRMSDGGPCVAGE